MTINTTQLFRQSAGLCHVVTREATIVKLSVARSHHHLDYNYDYDNDNDNRNDGGAGIDEETRFLKPVARRIPVYEPADRQHKA